MARERLDLRLPSTYVDLPPIFLAAASRAAPLAHNPDVRPIVCVKEIVEVRRTVRAVFELETRGMARGQADGPENHQRAEDQAAFEPARIKGERHILLRA